MLKLSRIILFLCFVVSLLFFTAAEAGLMDSIRGVVNSIVAGQQEDRRPNLTVKINSVTIDQFMRVVVGYDISNTGKTGVDSFPGVIYVGGEKAGEFGEEGLWINTGRAGSGT